MTPGRRSAVRIVGLAAVAAAATGFAVAWFGGDGSVPHWLLAYAGSLEFWGVLLVASPELAPYLRRLVTKASAMRRRTQALARRATDWLKTKIKGPSTRVVHIHAFDSAGASDSATAITSVDDARSMEEKIAFLLRRDKETQERLADFQEKLDELPERWRGDMRATAGTLRDEQRKGLDELRDEHLTARVGGVVLLVLGLVLATWGNLA